MREFKVPTPTGRIIDRQAALYAEGLFQGYRHCQPMPVGCPSQIDDSVVVPSLTELWTQWLGELSPPVPMNKLRGKGGQITCLNDLIRPETLAVMGDCPRCHRPACICPPGVNTRVTSQPLYDDDWRAYGCGCSR